MKLIQVVNAEREEQKEQFLWMVECHLALAREQAEERLEHQIKTGARSEEMQARLWDHVEKLARAYTIKGTRLRTNLAPDAPRDEWGLLVDPLPSDRIREGPLFEAVQRLLPVRTTTVQCNKFTSHEQCKFHVGKRNVGDSFLAILGGL